MMLILISLMAHHAGSLQDQAEPEAQEIIVTAKPQGCRVRLENRELTDRELDAKAREWARGVPVRVIASASADIKCLSTISFRLADKGVRLIEFVDPSGRAARPFVSPGISAQTNMASTEDRERAFVSRRAARLILEGKCAEARQLVLERGDLAAAADVVQICQSK